VFAIQSFRPGQAILVLTGPVLDHAEVLALGGDRAYALQIGRDEYLDAMPPGRYANHSCDPNAGIMNDRKLIALRAIGPGEEIQFDYSTAMSEDHWTMECRCAQPGCRRVILDFHHLPPITQNRYLQLGIVQRFIVNEVRRRSPARRLVRRTRAFREVSY
jgi:uncharacterized protein